MRNCLFIWRIFSKQSKQNDSLPIWTWTIAPFAITLAGAFLSDFLCMKNGALFIYLPIPLSIVLIHWWGNRILPSIYLATILRYVLINRYPDFTTSLFLGTHVVITAFASRFLFHHVAKGKSFLPNIENVAKFLVSGIMVPITINALYEIIQYDSITHSATDQVLFVWTADFASSCALSIPALFFITPYLYTKKVYLTSDLNPISLQNIFNTLKKKSLEKLFLTLALASITILLSIEKYWYVSGVLVVFIAIRFGFGFALMSNLIVFLLSCLRPFLIRGEASAPLGIGFLEIHQGMCLLGITAAITGRVVSDLRNTEKKLQDQNNELRQAHKELDKFVYSASHDLSAPLKSILGLINLSRIEKSEHERMLNLSRIEKSVIKLDGFIREILDYSRNSRLIIKPQTFTLKELLEDILENLRFMENFSQIKFDLNEIQINTIHTDRMRLQIILNNIISNAVRYHRIDDLSIKPRITIRSTLNHAYIKIEVQDNGVGIREDMQDKIFNMFYRGSITSTGSGLGLYIAKEAVGAISGEITVQSVYGLGSNFIIHIPKTKE